jgi:hypothetical protein
MKSLGVLVLSFASLLILSVGAIGAEPSTSPYAQWSHGPSSAADFFPISVWLQDPAKAGLYKAAGFNVYVGLWNGPTDDQLAQLKQVGMQVICSQNAVGLQHFNDPTIIGWLQDDEPDNAQAIAGGQYGPPILPETVVASYNRIRAADPNRPVLLNLSQGVAWDGWYGRGVRTNHPEDYSQYVQGCDIASFDIYPVANDDPQVSGKLWLVPFGVDRLKQWAGNRPVWNCLECTHINSKDHKATPQQVRCEVWMSLIAGSTGLIYFVHEWQPQFNESALLSDPNMLATVTQINQQIGGLAPVLNSPTLIEGAKAAPADQNVPIATLVKKYGGAVYLFAVTMRDGQTRARFALQGLSGPLTVEVMGENRTLQLTDGTFEDDFPMWGVHLYRIAVGP